MLRRGSVVEGLFFDLSVYDTVRARRLHGRSVCAVVRLPGSIRDRIHLVCVPMTDGDEAATIVNALQRHATVVVQKSLAEGFGLTVTEAMWKSRPVVASAVGGIVDQVVSGQTGWLVNPEDLIVCGNRIRALLDDPATASTMGAAAHERAVSEFLADRHL